MGGLIGMLSKMIGLISLLLFVSCEKFETPNAENLRGEYIIDIITFKKVDNTVNSEVFPMDSINLGSTTWRFDYNIISMEPVLDGSGGKIWTKQYYIDVTSYSGWENGYLTFNCEGTKRVFRVIDRQLESLTLRSSGQWPFGNAGSKSEITLQLSRVGP
jgi:hypothetical protein